MRLSPCACLHNYIWHATDPIDAKQYEDYLEEAPAYTEGQLPERRDFIKASIRKGDKKVLSKIMAAPINNTVWETLKVVLDCADNLDKKIRAFQKDKGVAVLGYAEKVAGLRKSLERCKRTYLENLELMNEGIISKDYFLVKRDRINAEIAGIETEIAEYEDKIQKISAVDGPETAKLKDALDKYSGSTELTNDLVRAFIDQVLMFEPGKIEIRWNFSEKLMKMLLEE